MKVGRNDPCPCGSGKKYKKCCLAADEAKVHAAIEPPPSKPAPAPPPQPAPRPVDPRQAAINQALDERYKQFKAADLDGKVAIYMRLVDGQGDPPMDDEDAFEMLNTLYYDLANANQRPRFDQLVDALRQKQPQVYEESKVNCLAWIVQNRAAQGRWDELAEPLNQLAALAGKGIDTLTRVLDMLDFHGRLPLLLDAAHIAWPIVKVSEEQIVPWAINEFASRASLYEIFDYLEHHPDASGGEEELLQRLRPYADDEPTWVSDYLKRLRQPVPPAAPLKLSDFDLKNRKPKRRRDEWDDDDEPDVEETLEGPERALLQLTTTFLGWMRRDRNVPFTRGEVGRTEMLRFLYQRADGELDDRRGMAERMMNPNRKPPKRKIEHPLCPDHDRFDAFLAGMLDMLSFNFHAAATLMHITPLWLEFLELNGLLTPEERRKANESLGDLREPLRTLLSQQLDDPRLIDALSESGWHL